MGVFRGFFLFFLVATTLVAANEENDNWPFYFKKCEPNNTNFFNTCLFYHANRALEYLYLGDWGSDFPAFVPFSQNRLTLGSRQPFKIHMSDVKVYGFNYCDVYNMRWDLKTKHVFIDIHCSNSITISGDYSANGKFRGQSLDGYGHAELSFLDENMTYNMTYTTQKINGMEYATISKCQGVRTQEYPRFYFNNEGATLEQCENLNNNLNANRFEFDRALSADLDNLICVTINKIFRPLFFNFPIDLMFD